MEYDNRIYVLDTTNVRRLAARNVAHLAQPWQPPQLAAQPARAVVSAYQQAKVERASVAVPDPGAIVYPPTVQSTNGKIAWLLKNGYSYRQIERELSVSHQTISMVKKAMEGQT